MKRRTFIKAGSLLTGGLLLSFHIDAAKRKDQPTDNVFNAYLSISSNGTVIITVPVPEIGQGVRTSLAMLVAEELEADWETIEIRQADAGDAYENGSQRAAGSNSVRTYWDPMRTAGATAREMLVQAAANKWNISTSQCEAISGTVRNKLTNSSLTYGQLATDAASLTAPNEVALKSPADFKVLGTSKLSRDVKSITNGAVQFGLDVSLPGMVYAAIERCQTYGGTVLSFDDSETLKVPGVIRAFKIPYFGRNKERPYTREGIAVVGKSTWAVLQGRKKLKIEWDLGPNTHESTDNLHTQCEALINKEGEDIVKNDGDTYGAFDNAAVKIDSTYHVQFIAHIPMEPVNCTVDLKKDSCEVWSTTQMPNNDWNYIADMVKIPKDKITLHVTRIGGGFGRRLDLDFTIEAIKVAQEIKKPVKLFWTREDDIQQDGYRPFSYHRLQAGLDRSGNLISWLHRQAGTSRHAFRTNSKPANSEFFPNHFPANLVKNFRLEYTLAKSNLSRSLIRAPGNNALGFVVESFIDELAHTAKKDPLQFRLMLLGNDQEFPFEDETVISTARMKGVLKLAAEKAGWGKPKPNNIKMGISGYFTFDTYVAHVAEVSINSSTGQLTIHKFTSAVDCGHVANVSGVKAQVEGSIVDGISAALHQEITVKAGAVEQSNFHDYHVLRLNEAPKEIDVHIVNSSFPPTGMGEPPYPPVASALCNAIFAASGIRIRRLPIKNQLRTG